MQLRMAKRKRTARKVDRAPIGKCFLCGDGSPAYKRAAIEDAELRRDLEKIAGRRITKKDAGTWSPNTRIPRDAVVVALCGKHYNRVKVSGRAKRIRKQAFTAEEVRYIRECYRKGHPPLTEVAKELGKPYQTVWKRAHMDYVEEEVD